MSHVGSDDEALIASIPDLGGRDDDLNGLASETISTAWPEGPGADGPSTDGPCTMPAQGEDLAPDAEEEESGADLTSQTGECARQPAPTPEARCTRTTSAPLSSAGTGDLRAPADIIQEEAVVGTLAPVTTGGSSGDTEEMEARAAAACEQGVEGDAVPDHPDAVFDPQASIADPVAHQTNAPEAEAVNGVATAPEPADGTTLPLDATLPAAAESKSSIADPVAHQPSALRAEAVDGGATAPEPADGTTLPMDAILPSTAEPAGHAAAAPLVSKPRSRRPSQTSGAGGSSKSGSLTRRRSHGSKPAQAQGQADGPMEAEAGASAAAGEAEELLAELEAQRAKHAMHLTLEAKAKQELEQVSGVGGFA